MDPFSTAKAKMADLARAHVALGDMNEATTRLRIIDKLLFECLGWHVSDAEAEKPYNREYVDYALGRPVTEAILEAKREGIYFNLPAGLEGRRTVDIETLLSDPATKAAVTQVMGYCQTRGVPIAIICNGHQIAAFYASRQDGVPPLSGRALIFSSLTEMYDEFTLFWNFLSRDGVAARNLQRVLFGKAFQALPPGKLSDRVTDYPGYRVPNTADTNLKILGNLFIQDLEYEPELSNKFLRDCYVPSGALSQYALVSKEILSARYAAIQESAKVDIQALRSPWDVTRAMTADTISAAMSRRPLILIGDVGVGKSMFLRHLIGVEAVDLLKNVLVAYIDFGKEPALPADLETYVGRRLTQQLKDGYRIDVDSNNFVRSVYNKEINEFKDSVYATQGDEAEVRREEVKMLISHMSDRSEHLRRSLEHIRATSKRTFLLVLDNVDQRPTEFQDRVFLIAQTVAETWPVTVFVSLRPSTFYQSRSKGSLAAYQLRVFTITPTRADEVILQRLAFAKALVISTGSAGVFPQKMTFTSEQMASYIDVLIKAFRENRELNKLVDNLSGGNLRLALTFLSSFVGTAYVSTQRILEIMEAGGTYNLPEHEFLRSMIYGDCEYYSPKTSEICNLFDVTIEDGKEHFLMPIILSFIQRQGEAAGSNGYVDVADLYRFIQPYGFLQEQVGSHIQRALGKRLLDAPEGRGVGGPLRITTVGSYMYKSMIQRFTYIDAMIVDTPIVNLEWRKRITDVRPILERLERADIFRQYLDEQWDKWEAAENGSAFDWRIVSAELDSDIKAVRQRASRAQQRPTWGLK
jgi:hypothetical protein